MLPDHIGRQLTPQHAAGLALLLYDRPQLAESLRPYTRGNILCEWIVEAIGAVADRGELVTIEAVAAELRSHGETGATRWDFVFAGCGRWIQQIMREVPRGLCDEMASLCDERAMT